MPSIEVSHERVACPKCHVVHEGEVHRRTYGGQIENKTVIGECSVCETPLDPDRAGKGGDG